MRKRLLLFLMLLLWVPLQVLGQTGETVFVSTFSGHQILKIVDGSPVTTTVINTDTTESPEDIVVGPDAKIYICDGINNDIRRMNQDGTQVETVYSGTPSGPEGPSFSTTGDLYFNTRGPTHTGVWKIPSSQLNPIPTGGATPINVLTALQTGSTFGEGSVFDGSNDLLIVDRSGNRVLRSIPPYSSSPPFITGLSSPFGVAVNRADGKVFVANNGAVSVFDGTTLSTYVTFASPDSPLYLEVDASGHLFVVTVQNSSGGFGKVWRVDPGPPVTKTLLVDLSMPSPAASNSAVGLAVGATSASIKIPLNPAGGTFVATFGTYNYKSILPPSPSYSGVVLVVTAIDTPQSVFKQRVAGTPFASSVCAPYGGAGAGSYCETFEITCQDTMGNPITCPIPPSPYHVLTSYNTQLPQPNPCFLRFPIGSNQGQNILVAFFQQRIDQTADGIPPGYSDFIVCNLTAPSSDPTPPNTVASTSPAPNLAGWNNSNVTVTLIGDAGIPGGSLVNSLMFSATGAQPIVSTTLNASNLLTFPFVTFPTIPMIMNEGLTTLTFSSTSFAGGMETSKMLAIKLDKTPPSINITSPTNGATYTITQPVAASYQCADPVPSGVNQVSGVAFCTAPVASGSNIDTASLGSKTFTVNASDVAGNTASQSVTYTVAGFNICLLYDPTRAAKSGSTIPIKLQLCDANANDLSSSSIIVHATSVVQTSTFASSTVIDAGNANPDNDFRFDSTLGPTGGYIFNLKTTGLTTGSYVLNFTAGPDPTIHSAPFQVR